VKPVQPAPAAKPIQVAKPQQPAPIVVIPVAAPRDPLTAATHDLLVRMALQFDKLEEMAHRRHNQIVAQLDEITALVKSVDRRSAPLNLRLPVIPVAPAAAVEPLPQIGSQGRLVRQLEQIGELIGSLKEPAQEVVKVMALLTRQAKHTAKHPAPVVEQSAP